MQLTQHTVYSRIYLARMPAIISLAMRIKLWMDRALDFPGGVQ